MRSSLQHRISFQFGKAVFAGALTAAVLLQTSVGRAEEEQAQVAQTPSENEQTHSVVAQTPSALEAITKEVGVVFEKCRGAIARIQAEDEHGSLVGSGFFVDPNGILFTTYSIGGETRNIVVTVGESKYPAQRIIADARSGIAVLKVDASTPFLKLGKSRDLEICSPVIVVGYPLDLPISPSFGCVAGFDMGRDGKWFAMRHIRANVPVQRGESGAPLLNVKGEVMGMLVSTIDQNSGALSVPAEAADKIYQDYLRYGRVKPGWLGVDVRPSDAIQQGSSARIRTLQHNGAGHKGGLRPGDVITHVGGWKVSSPEDVINASFYLVADEELAVGVCRAGQKMELKLTPVEPPHSAGKFPLEASLNHHIFSK